MAVSRRDHRGYVLYVLRAPEQRLLMLGVSRSVERRVAELGAFSPVPLEVLAMIPCVGKRPAYDLVAELWGALAEVQSHGEWYADTPSVRCRLNELLSADEGRIDRRQLRKMRDDAAVS